VAKERQIPNYWWPSLGINNEHKQLQLNVNKIVVGLIIEKTLDRLK
jgi:hypothetical protein